MEFYNPITELEWLYGEWEGNLENEEGEFKTSLTIKSIGSEIIEFNSTIIKGKSKIQSEKNIFFYDKIHELVKVFSVNQEGYIEIADISIVHKNKRTIITSTFNSGFNLPPNMKISKKWEFRKDPKLVNYAVKMGKNERIVLSSKLAFSRF
ncbi:MAG: hypothetical protein GOP50_03905 [Candidatus Heimdallarchaeota archaeon]|nr:hypothetical protein [Candidatus Heimdallarchaeota archaeon]